MRSMAGDIATGYWHDAVYDPVGMFPKGTEAENMKEGDSSEPLKFKLYRGLPRYSLPPPMLMLQVPGQPPAGDALDGEILSTFVYYAYGVGRHDPEPGTRPYHRMVPSARCFFPTELYLALPKGGSRPAGVYYYDPMHHALVSVRKGDHRDLIAEAVGADLAASVGVVLLTSLFWKTAFRYRDYAYRLCCQEVGIVAGSVLLVASALGMEGHAHFLFLDDVLNRLLGLAVPEENTMLVLPLYERRTPGREPERSLKVVPPARSRTDILKALPELPTVHVQPSAYDPEAVPVLTRISRKSFMTSLGRMGPRTKLRPPKPRNGRGTIVVPSVVDTEAFDLAEALRSRDSGPEFMSFLPSTGPDEVVWRIARGVTKPYPTDIVPASNPPPCDCFLIIRSVAGFAEGIYHVSLDGMELETLALGPVGPALRQIPSMYSGGFPIPNVNFAESNLMVFLAVPHRTALSRYGPRGFRILSQVAGIAALRTCVMSARSGLPARVHNGYSARAVEELLGIMDGANSVLFQIAIGASRPGVGLRLPVVF